MRRMRSVWGSGGIRSRNESSAKPRLEWLEDRTVPTAILSFTNNILSVTGTTARQHLWLYLDSAQSQVVVQDFGQEIGRFDAASVNEIILTGVGQDYLGIANSLTAPAIIQETGSGYSTLIAGGGVSAVIGGTGDAKIYAGLDTDTLIGGTGRNYFFEVKQGDQVSSHAGDRITYASNPPPTASTAPPTLTSDDVQQIIDRAAAASASNDAIIAVMDRNGRVLGVRVESGVSTAITSNPQALTFAIDGALAEARTGAFFGNDQAPLTSRTIQFISQSTITQREVDSSPDVMDPNSPLRGPGTVAPIGIGGHFPPGVSFTPQVDLFNIEETNRDSLVPYGPNGNKDTNPADQLPSRFNVPLQFIPGGQPLLFAPESYGFLSGIDPSGQGRGIGTLPGGTPIYKNDPNTNTPIEVGGIGIFFPGTTGYASAENSALSADYNPAKRDRSLEAEYMAFAALGSAPGIGLPVGNLAGVAPVAGISTGPLTPSTMRIDLVGITLDIFGPGGTQGPQHLAEFGATLGTGNPYDGVAEPIAPGAAPASAIQVAANNTAYYSDGLVDASGWLVTPHAGDGISAAQVTQIITDGIDQANLTRAAIRLPLDNTTKMVFAVSDKDGNLLGLYRMPDATIFSVDVAVAKSRNVAYYDSTDVQPVDQVPGVPAGVAFTNRTFRYAAEPRFPEGIDGAPPGPFSILNDGGTDPTTGLEVGPPLPVSAFQSVQGYDAFHPSTNFRDPNNPRNQNGIVFFPGSSPLYTQVGMVGGFGVSGDGVDQDDVVTIAGAAGYGAPVNLQADQYFYAGVRLPYQKNNRNPEGGIV